MSQSDKLKPSKAASGGLSAVMKPSETASSGGGLSAVMKPSEATEKRVVFLLNNMSDQNTEQVAKEIASVVPAPFESWLGLLLAARCRAEGNLVELYASFTALYGSHSQHFAHALVETVKREIDAILSGRTIDVRATSHLRNLGALLGCLTLARDVHLCVDLKALLRDCYQDYRDSLEFILPFVCHVLRGLKAARLITLSHPWAQEILAVVKELYELTADRIAVQFEIELLFNHLNRSPAEIRAAFYLRHNPRKRHPCNARCG